MTVLTITGPPAVSECKNLYIMCLFLKIISVFSFSFTLKIWSFNQGVDRKLGHPSCCWYDSKTMLLCWNCVKVEVCAGRTPSRHLSEWPVQTGVFVCSPLGGPRHLRLFRRAADLIKPTFNPGQLISRLLIRCEQIRTGPCPAGMPRRGAGPPRTAVRLYNYMSFVWAWSVFPQGLSVRSFASAGMLLLLLSCSSQRSHKVLLMFPVDFWFFKFSAQIRPESSASFKHKPSAHQSECVLVFIQ